MVLTWCQHSQQLLLMTFAPRYCNSFPDWNWSSRKLIFEIHSWIPNLSSIRDFEILKKKKKCYFQVTASSWFNDFRDQIEHTRVLNVFYRSATALGSRLPSIASTKARVAGAGALLKPVSSSTQVKFSSLLWVYFCWFMLLSFFKT